jgi:hypothetical protein
MGCMHLKHTKITYHGVSLISGNCMGLNSKDIRQWLCCGQRRDIQRLSNVVKRGKLFLKSDTLWHVVRQARGVCGRIEIISDCGRDFPCAKRSKAIASTSDSDYGDPCNLQEMVDTGKLVAFPIST